MKLIHHIKMNIPLILQIQQIPLMIIIKFYTYYNNIKNRDNDFHFVIPKIISQIELSFLRQPKPYFILSHLIISSLTIK